IVHWTIRIPQIACTVNGLCKVGDKRAKQVALAKSGKASSNNPVECLKLEIRKRSFLLRRSNKSQLILNENQKQTRRRRCR
ncbi:hypothetical protein WQ51_05040, partial [Streptococcus suis]